MTDEQRLAIERNLFPGARGLVRESTDFPWHRDDSGQFTASYQNSSQALAIDVFETVDQLRSRNRIVDAWGKLLRLPLAPADNWDLTLEYPLPKAMLGELRETQIDVLARSSSGIIVFECKFTEADGGGCSQVHKLGKGAHKELRQCNGNYQEQVNPVNRKSARCALTAKGVRYWELIPDVMNIDANVDHTPCPVAGGSYQWMRNLVAAHALSRTAGVPAAFGLIYAEGPFPIAKKLKDPEWREQLNDSVDGRAVHVEAISYQELIWVARNAAAIENIRMLDDLRDWVQIKCDDVGRHLAA